MASPHTYLHFNQPIDDDFAHVFGNATTDLSLHHAGTLYATGRRVSVLQALVRDHQSDRRWLASSARMTP